MYFEEEEDRFVERDIISEIYCVNPRLDLTYGMQYVPTHTEDGIPIRKLYVTNLPLGTTRNELFNLFGQYGFIIQCWLKYDFKQDRSTFGFITFREPGDAHKALMAPAHEKNIRGHNLFVSPADSWHQPHEDANGQVICNRANREQLTSIDYPDDEAAAGAEASTSAASAPRELTILDILNTDCLKHILDYIPIRELIKTERVSKRWRLMIREYFQGTRMFKTSWWQHAPVVLTTAVLRRVLLRVGGSLTCLHVDHHWSALNDRTANTIGKFCPNLEELKVVGMHTKNWIPVTNGCKKLKRVSFVSCSKLSDRSLLCVMKSEHLEEIKIGNNTHVTGMFLSGATARFRSAIFYNCYNLQGCFLNAAADCLPQLTTLKLDLCPPAIWSTVPLILKKLPKLVELSLSEYTSPETSLDAKMNEDFCESLAHLTELKTLDLNQNIYITNAVMKQVGKSCTKLRDLNVSSCNSRKEFPYPGVGDEGVSAVCKGCRELICLDVSYLAALGDTGLRSIGGLTQLAQLITRGNPALTATSISHCIATCHALEEVDACGCEYVSEEVVSAAKDALDVRPRPLTLRLAATAACTLQPQEFPTHKLLKVDILVDSSNPHMRPDYVERIFDDSSDNSLEDFYDQLQNHENFDDLFEEVDEDMDEFFYDEDDLEDYEDIIHLHAHNIILL